MPISSSGDGGDDNGYVALGFPSYHLLLFDCWSCSTSFVASQYGLMTISERLWMFTYPFLPIFSYVSPSFLHHQCVWRWLSGRQELHTSYIRLVPFPLVPFLPSLRLRKMPKKSVMSANGFAGNPPTQLADVWFTICGTRLGFDRKPHAASRNQEANMKLGFCSSISAAKRYNWSWERNCSV